MLTNILNKGEQSLSFKKTKDYKLSETIPDPDMSGKVKMADIFAVAMKREERAVDMYLKLAADTADPAMKKVFTELSEMERGHKQRLEQAYIDVAFVEVW